MHERQGTELQTQSQISLRAASIGTIQDRSSVDFHHNHSIPERPAPFTPQTTASSLATQESRVSFDDTVRAAPGRRGSESELEISQKTLSAYESLPRGMTRFRSDENKEEGDGTNTTDLAQCECTLAEAVENYPNATPLDLESISPISNRDYTYVTSHADRHISFLSTISNVSTGSGYVISSLNSPGPQGPSTNRMSCYSNHSDGYVISHSEWCAGKPTISPGPALPVIEEDSSTYAEYLQVIP